METSSKNIQVCDSLTWFFIKTFAVFFIQKPLSNFYIADMKFVRLNLRAERERVDAELDARAQADDARAQYLLDVARRQRLTGQARVLAEMDQRWRVFADKLVRC